MWAAVVVVGLVVVTEEEVAMAALPLVAAAVGVIMPLLTIPVVAGTVVRVVRTDTRWTRTIEART
jgi:hypothetical protein